MWTGVSRKRITTGSFSVFSDHLIRFAQHLPLQGKALVGLSLRYHSFAVPSGLAHVMPPHHIDPLLTPTREQALVRPYPRLVVITPLKTKQ